MEIVIFGLITALRSITWIIIIQVILHYGILFGIRVPFLSQIDEFLDIFYTPIRKILPTNFLIFDLAPLILMIVCQLLMSLLYQL